MPANRRDEWPWQGNSDTSLSKISKAMRATEPRLGRAFVEGERAKGSLEPHYTIADALIDRVGATRYGNVLQRLKAAPARRRPRRRRRKAVAA